MTDVLATNAELESLKKAAGIPYLPTQLTFEARLAIGGEGPRAYDWSDKPHRLVFDLCREIEKNAAERDRLREALTFYAAPETYQDTFVAEDCECCHRREHPAIEDDNGKVARAALKGESHD